MKLLSLGSQVRILPGAPRLQGFILDTWFTFYTEDMGDNLRRYSLGGHIASQAAIWPHPFGTERFFASGPAQELFISPLGQK